MKQPTPHRRTWVRQTRPAEAALLPDQMPVDLFFADAAHDTGGPRRSTFVPRS